MAEYMCSLCMIIVHKTIFFQRQLHYVLCVLHREKKSKAKKRRSRVTSSVISGESLEELAKQFGISEDKIRRMQSHSGQLEGDKEQHDEDFSSLSNSRAL